MTNKVERDERKTVEGVVVSDKMDKTRVVSIERRLRHTLYGKVQIRSTKLYAHDEKNESKAGDRIAIAETRPMSKNKRWRLVKILVKAQGGASVSEALGENK